MWYFLNWFFYILEKNTRNVKDIWLPDYITYPTCWLDVFFHHHSQTNSLKSSTSKSWNMSCHSLMIESELDQVILPLRQTINGDCSWPLKKMASWKCLKGIKHLAIVHETAGESGYPSPNGSCWCIFCNFRRHPEKIWNMLGLSIMFPVNPRKYVWLQIQFFYPSCSLNFRRASEINKKIWLLAVWFPLISAMSLTKIKWARFQRMGTVLQANGNRSPVWGWKKKKTWNISRCRSIEKQDIYIYMAAHIYIYIVCIYA